VGDLARRGEVIERQLGALIAGVELRRAQIDRVGPIGHGGADGINAPGGSQQFRYCEGHA
jgi:hypothetical protein